jgi:hypothetical protein
VKKAENEHFKLKLHPFQDEKIDCINVFQDQSRLTKAKKSFSRGKYPWSYTK